MRARNIKPGFFLNDKLAECDFETRLLFIGLWCYADREGRFEWIPKRIKAAIFPYDGVDVEKCLCNLMSLHFITCNDNVGYIENFNKHQKPHPHEAKSTLPPKPAETLCNDMSLHVTASPCNVTKCNADIIIPDIMIPDTIKHIPETSLAFLWNQTCTNLPKVKEMSEARKKKEKQRFSERSIASWEEVFKKINSSKFCQGHGNTGWKATYDWIISNSENSIKVLEGKYDGHIGRGQQPLAYEAGTPEGKYANIPVEIIDTDYTGDTS